MYPTPLGSHVLDIPRIELFGLESSGSSSICLDGNPLYCKTKKRAWRNLPLTVIYILVFHFGRLRRCDLDG